MRPSLNNMALVHNDDLVRIGNSRQAMSKTHISNLVHQKKKRFRQRLTR